jgi:hypothetical protein
MLSTHRKCVEMPTDKIIKYHSVPTRFAYVYPPQSETSGLVFPKHVATNQGLVVTYFENKNTKCNCAM